MKDLKELTVVSEVRGTIFYNRRNLTRILEDDKTDQ